MGKYEKNYRDISSSRDDVEILICKKRCKTYPIPSNIEETEGIYTGENTSESKCDYCDAIRNTNINRILNAFEKDYLVPLQLAEYIWLDVFVGHLNDYPYYDFLSELIELYRPDLTWKQLKKVLLSTCGSVEVLNQQLLIQRFYNFTYKGHELIFINACHVLSCGLKLFDTLECSAVSDIGTRFVETLPNYIASELPFEELSEDIWSLLKFFSKFKNDKLGNGENLLEFEKIVSQEWCYICRKPGHRLKNCFKKNNQCFGCGSPKHNVQICPDPFMIK